MKMVLSTFTDYDIVRGNARKKKKNLHKYKDHNEKLLKQKFVSILSSFKVNNLEKCACN